MKRKEVTTTKASFTEGKKEKLSHSDSSKQLVFEDIYTNRIPNDCDCTGGTRIRQHIFYLVESENKFCLSSKGRTCNTDKGRKMFN